MKKLILLLLFIPLASIGQLSFNDLMELNSQQAFEKFMFDEQFSATDQKDDYNSIFYALNPSIEDGVVVSTHFAHYTPTLETFWFSFIREGKRFNPYTGVVSFEGVISNDYDTILKKAKRKCKFVKMYKLENDNWAIYDCKKAEFKGYLGFTVIAGQGNIANFLFID